MQLAFVVRGKIRSFNKQHHPADTATNAQPAAMPPLAEISFSFTIMEDYKFLRDRKVAMVVTNIEKENDVRVYLGEIVEMESEFHFINKPEDWNVTLELEDRKSVV